jgi:enoyl-CoA hydratase
MATPGLTVTEDGHIAQVTLDRPPVNALDRAAYLSIAEVFASFTERTDVRAVVFTGAGTRAFCAGRDVKDLAATGAAGGSVDVADPLRAAREAFWAVRRCAVPVICAVNGPAIGAGLVLVAVSDVAVAAEHASFALTEIDVGVVGGASFAQWMVGPAKARRMLFTGEKVSAHEMHRLGGVDSVYPVDQVLAEARAIAETIATKDPAAIRMAKASVVRSDTLPLEQAYRTEQDYTLHLRNLSGGLT